MSIDRLNETDHPTKGLKSYIQSKLIAHSFPDIKNAKKDFWVTAGHTQILPISKKAIASFSAQVGMSTGFIDRQFLFYQGGLYNQARPNLIIQPGTRLMRYGGRNAAALSAQIEFNLFSSHYLGFGYGFSNLSTKPKNLLTGDWQQGFYAGYHIGTIIGPINLKAGVPADDFDPQFFVSVGHFF